MHYSIITVEWNDWPAYNEFDTELGTVEDNKLSIPIKVSAVQYLGETITPYTGE